MPHHRSASAPSGNSSTNHQQGYGGSTSNQSALQPEQYPMSSNPSRFNTNMPSAYSTDLRRQCRLWLSQGTCRFGSRCLYLHSPEYQGVFGCPLPSPSVPFWYDPWLAQTAPWMGTLDENQLPPPAYFTFGQTNTGNFNFRGNGPSERPGLRLAEKYQPVAPVMLPRHNHPPPHTVQLPGPELEPAPTNPKRSSGSSSTGNSNGLSPSSNTSSPIHNDHTYCEHDTSFLEE